MERCILNLNYCFMIRSPTEIFIYIINSVILLYVKLLTLLALRLQHCWHLALPTTPLHLCNGVVALFCVCVLRGLNCARAPFVCV